MPTTLRLTRDRVRDDTGCEVLRLDRYSAGGAHLGRLLVCSGQPDRQVFRRADDPAGRTGSMEPLPEGRYLLGLLEWAGRPSDFAASWGAGLGPLWTDVIPTMETPREAIGIHLDANRRRAPGTAGCVGIVSEDDLRTWAGWWSDQHGRPSELIVDWGLGTVPAPPTTPPPAPQVERWTIHSHDGRHALIMADGTRVDLTGIKIDGVPYPGGTILLGARRS